MRDEEPAFLIALVCLKCGANGFDGPYIVYPQAGEQAESPAAIWCGNCENRAYLDWPVRPGVISAPVYERVYEKMARKKKKGRPLIEDVGKTYEAIKPWLKDGMSRSTWYRRRKERGEK